MRLPAAALTLVVAVAACGGERRFGPSSPSSPAAGIATTRDGAEGGPRQVAQAEPIDVDPTASSIARSAKLLVVAIQQMQQLLETTPATAPDRAVLLHRLAEDYEELERAMKREPRVGVSAARARAMAVAFYQKLVHEHPAYPRMEEARFRLGRAQARAGNGDVARETFERFLADIPQSRFAPAAMFALGELHMRASELDAAEASYASVLELPRGRTLHRAYALLRLAQIARRRGDEAKAQGYEARLHVEFRGSVASAPPLAP